MHTQSTGARIARFLAGKSEYGILACSIGAVLFIGVCDYIFPYEFSMSIFYVAPILLAAWYAGKKHADLTAIIALIVTWWTDELTADPHHLGSIHTYKMFVRLFFFLAISMGAAALKAHRDLAAAQIELLERSQRLEREIIKISEREQQRIGQDLHDGLCQYMAALACATTSLKNDLQKSPHAAALQPEVQSATEIAELIKQGVTQARNLARGLSPVHADESGLDSALQELAAYSSRMLGIECEYDSAAPVSIRDNTAAGHLYRIAQEAINNATRHGCATRVTIQLSENEGLVTLRVTDNGKGLPGHGMKSGGMGTKIMDYRARLIDGELAIAGNSFGTGVTITCSFRQQGAADLPRPLAPAAEPQRELSAVLTA